MEYKDTKYLDLNTTLNAIGKATFINFYYDFKNDYISDNELAKKILRENPKTHSMKQSFRIPRARHIFQIGKEIEALEIVINSPKVEFAARERAKEILENELHYSDLKKEQDFIFELNRNIEYADGVETEYEYENSHKLPKEIVNITSYKYPRSRQVAKRALAKAKYMCEFDNTHITFKRKNCSWNYTEPHHLVPLSAAKDFPGIDLDREQNVVSLCSNCHNWLHYGENIDIILKPLYEERKELLKSIGIDITYEQLKNYYN